MVFTSQAAHCTLNPSYLLLDLSESASLPDRLGPQLLFRVRRVSHPTPPSGRHDGSSRAQASQAGADLCAVSSVVLGWSAGGCCSVDEEGQEAALGYGEASAAIEEAGEVLCEVMVEVPGLWHLPFAVDLPSLPLHGPNALVLATEEAGGRGPLVLPATTYEALVKVGRQQARQKAGGSTDDDDDACLGGMCVVAGERWGWRVGGRRAGG